MDASHRGLQMLPFSRLQYRLQRIGHAAPVGTTEQSPLSSAIRIAQRNAYQKTIQLRFR